MSGVRTVYAVVSGDYSSYRVHCLFEDEATAEAYIEAWSSAFAVTHEGEQPWEPLETQTFQLWSVLPVVTPHEDGDGRYTDDSPLVTEPPPKEVA